MSGLQTYKNIYLVGIGGIGMSALARYFKYVGKNVAGYDRVESPLTQALASEGISIHYEDQGSDIAPQFKDPSNTLVVYTPAIKVLAELTYFRQHNFTIYKRAEVLGALTRTFQGLCVAGTHGKTTTSSLLAFLLTELTTDCTAFLGGIATNFNSNLVLHPQSKYAVIEADEFDRSFLHLAPYAAIVTATDPDHLDIYGSEQAFVEGFRQFVMRIDPKGYSIQKNGLNLPSLAKVVTYGVDDPKADYNLTNLRFVDGYQIGDVYYDSVQYADFKFGLPGVHNAENALACIALLNQIGYGIDELRSGVQGFKGVKRRFEYHVRSSELIYIDDYAHHPVEIKALLLSVRKLYPELPLIGIFQPHLYSRTKDFAPEFASALSELDSLYLLPIYAAREEPIAGVSSEWLCELAKVDVKQVLEPIDLLSKIRKIDRGVVLTIGAGDIDRLVGPIKETLQIHIQTL